jgi:hypothetical protein
MTDIIEAIQARILELKHTLVRNKISLRFEHSEEYTQQLLDINEMILKRLLN